MKTQHLLKLLLFCFPLIAAAQWEEIGSHNPPTPTTTFFISSQFNPLLTVSDNGDVYTVAREENISSITVSGNIQNNTQNASIGSSSSFPCKIYSGSSFSTIPYNFSEELNNEHFRYLTTNNNELYLAMINADISNRPYLYKYTSTSNSWQIIGGVAISSDLSTSVTASFDSNDVPYVAYIKNGTGIQVKTFTGTSWQDYGSIQSTSNVGTFKLVFDNNDVAYLAYRNSNDGFKINVKRYNEMIDDWEDVASSQISTGFSQYVNIITKNGEPYVAFRDQGIGANVIVKRFDGTNWVDVGTTNPTNSGADISMSISSDGTIFIAFKDFTNGSKATVKRLIGNDWVAVGSEGFTPNSADFLRFDVANDNTAYVLYYNPFYEEEKIKTNLYKFNGNTLSTDTIETGEPSKVFVFPNPVENELKIKSEFSIKNIIIYNELGQEVLQTTNTKINTSHLSSGMYFVKVKTQQGSSFRDIKIIKR